MSLPKSVHSNLISGHYSVAKEFLLLLLLVLPCHCFNLTFIVIDHNCLLYLLPLCRPLQLKQRNVVHERGVVESGVDDDVGDVELLVPKGLRSRAHVVLAKANLQDLADGAHEREAAENLRKTSHGV